jgi:hypothetical protein
LINDFTLVDNGMFFNLNAKTKKTFISKQGSLIFWLKDTLLISSLMSRKSFVSENDFKAARFI